MENIFHFEDGSRLIGAPDKAVTPAHAAAAGRACGAVCSGTRRIMVSHSEQKGAAALAQAFASGAASSGADCIITEVCPPTACAYSARKLDCEMSCSIHTEITASFRLTAGDGLELFERVQDKIIQRLSSPEPYVPYSHYGEISRINSAGEMYISHLRKLYSGVPDGIYADICTSSPAVSRCCKRLFEGRNDISGKRLAFHINSGGDRISAYSDETGHVIADKLLLICCRDSFERGMDVAFCGRTMRAAEKLAEKYGRQVITCGKGVCVSDSSPSDRCSKARELASRQLFTRDSIALCAAVTDVLKRRGTTLAQELAELPSYASVERYIPVNKPSELLRKLCSVRSDRQPDGVLSDGETGRVVIRPIRTGKGLMLSVESYALEAASELCDFYTGIIKKSEQQ